MLLNNVELDLKTRLGEEGITQKELDWLDDAYGFEQVSLFCFGQKSFEEAFGTDFQSAFDDWHAWIEQTYPAE